MQEQEEINFKQELKLNKKHQQQQKNRNRRAIPGLQQSKQTPETPLKAKQ